MPELHRVLCVEDDPDIRMILEFSLGHLGGYTVMACASGPEALDAAGRFAPELVLLDVMMPKMSGPETLTRLRQLPCMHQVPVVFVTARALPEEVEGLLAHGADAIILKPFDPVTLPQEIHAIWERSHGN